MDTIKAFEKVMREANFTSLDAARKGLLAHPLAGDYLLSLLVSRGALQIMEDGSAIGGEGPIEYARSENPDKPKMGAGEWKKEWPSRDLLMCYLDCPDGDKSAKFRWIQEMLAARGQPATHWITLHAIWHLMKHGFAEKVRGGYRLTEKGKDSTEGTPLVEGESGAATKGQVAEFKAAIAEMPPEMIEILESVLKDEVEANCTAQDFSSAVGVYVDAGEWMGRPEMRGGFNLAFVRWAQAEYGARGKLT